MEVYRILALKNKKRLMKIENIKLQHNRLILMARTINTETLKSQGFYAKSPYYPKKSQK
mgnify:CR=1 FL=1